MLSPVVAPAQTPWFREVEVLRSKRDWHAFWGVFVKLNQEDVAPCTVVPEEGAGSHAIDLYVHPRRRPIGASLGPSILWCPEVVFFCRLCVRLF